MSKILSLKEAEKLAASCTACPLHETATKLVYMRGAPTAKVVIIGEAPGAEEDATGQPFVGRSGQIVDKLLAKAKIDEYAIVNVLKHRPPDNRDPKPDEIAACSIHLQRQLQALRPDVLILLGTFATKYILGREAAVGTYRGQVVKVQPPYLDYAVRVVATYHPGAFLHSGKASFLEMMRRDFQLAAGALRAARFEAHKGPTKGRAGVAL